MSEDNRENRMPEVLPSEPPLVGTEIETLLGSLERQRATFAWKTGNLDAAGLAATVGASAMTLGGLVKHLARCEDDVFGGSILGRASTAPFDSPECAADDWEWHSAARDEPEELYALWAAACDRSRAILADVINAGGLDRPTPSSAASGKQVGLRRYLVDMIEEYARHVGHADLIRESVDGLVGEDPPRLGD